MGRLQICLLHVSTDESLDGFDLKAYNVQYLVDNKAFASSLGPDARSSGEIPPLFLVLCMLTGPNSVRRLINLIKDEMATRANLATGFLGSSHR